jgi:hypothetical protein
VAGGVELAAERMAKGPDVPAGGLDVVGRVLDPSGRDEPRPELLAQEPVQPAAIGGVWSSVYQGETTCPGRRSVSFPSRTTGSPLTMVAFTPWPQAL